MLLLNVFQGASLETNGLLTRCPAFVFNSHLGLFKFKTCRLALHNKYCKVFFLLLPFHVCYIAEISGKVMA